MLTLKELYKMKRESGEQLLAVQAEKQKFVSQMNFVEEDTYEYNRMKKEINDLNEVLRKKQSEIDYVTGEIEKFSFTSDKLGFKTNAAKSYVSDLIYTYGELMQKYEQCVIEPETGKDMLSGKEEAEKELREKLELYYNLIDEAKRNPLYVYTDDDIEHAFTHGATHDELTESMLNVQAKYGATEDAKNLASEMLILEDSVSDSRKQAFAIMDQADEQIQLIENTSTNMEKLSSSENIEKMQDINHEETIDMFSETDPIISSSKEMLLRAQKEMVQHPFRYAKHVLKTAIDEYNDAKETVLNAEKDYADKLGAICELGKRKPSFTTPLDVMTSDTIKTFSTNSASILNNAYEEIGKLGRDIIEKSKEILYNLHRGFDSALEFFTIGKWSQFCQTVEAKAADKKVRDAGVGEMTRDYESRSKLMAEHGLLINKLFEIDIYKNSSMLKNINNKSDKTFEILANAIVSSRRAITETKNNELGATEEDYWQSIRTATWGAEVKSPAQKLDDLLKNYTELRDKKIKNAEEMLTSFLSTSKARVEEIIAKTMGEVKLFAIKIEDKAFSIKTEIIKKKVDFISLSAYPTAAKVKTLRSTDKMIHEQMEKINKDINDLIAIQPYQKKPYTPNPQIENDIKLLKGMESSTAVNFMIKQYEKKLKKEELYHINQEQKNAAIYEKKLMSSAYDKSFLQNEIENCKKAKEENMNKLKVAKEKLEVVLNQRKEVKKDINKRIDNKEQGERFERDE